MKTELYSSPIGPLALEADAAGLTAVHFVRAGEALPQSRAAGEEGAAALAEARRWLEEYFSGRVPDFLPPLHLVGTSFRREVWALLLEIPYGRTVTYGMLAERLAQRHGIPRMAAQAVGGAVGANPVAILVPCHRVLGVHDKLTGYGGGLDKKAALLRLEGIPFRQ